MRLWSNCVFVFVVIDATVLAAWMRLKYPHIAIGALASSAPILQFEDVVPPETFYDIASNDFKVIHTFASLSRLTLSCLS